jgi:hypothetical protein
MYIHDNTDRGANMAEYEHHGCKIERDPVPIEVGGVETTGWEFVIHKDGVPLPFIVRSVNRKLGLRETRKRIDRFLAESATTVRIGDLQSIQSY